MWADMIITGLFYGIVFAFPMGMLEAWKPKIFWFLFTALCLYCVVDILFLGANTLTTDDRGWAFSLSVIVGTWVGMSGGNATYKRFFKKGDTNGRNTKRNK